MLKQKIHFLKALRDHLDKPLYFGGVEGQHMKSKKLTEAQRI